MKLLKVKREIRGNCSLRKGMIQSNRFKVRMRTKGYTSKDLLEESVYPFLDQLRKRARRC